MKSLIIVFFMIISVFSYSCKDSRLDDNPVNPGASGSIMPLSNGNWWNYTVSAFDTTGKQLTFDGTFKYETRIFTMGADTVMFNSSCHPLLNFFDESKTMYYTSKADGIWASMIVKNGVKTNQYLTFKYPASKNDTYLSADNDLVTVMSTQETVHIDKSSPQRDFVTYHYKFNDPEVEVHFYLSQGVGIVKIEFNGIYEVNNQFNRVKLVYELADYHVN